MSGTLSQPAAGGRHGLGSLPACTFADVQARDRRADLAEGRQPGVKHAGQAAGAQARRPGDVGHGQLERDLHQRRTAAARQGLGIHLRAAGVSGGSTCTSDMRAGERAPCLHGQVG